MLWSCIKFSQIRESCGPINSLYENNKFILEAQNLSNDGKRFQESKNFQYRMSKALHKMPRRHVCLTKKGTIYNIPRKFPR